MKDDDDFFAAMRWLRGKPAITKEMQTDVGRMQVHVGEAADRAALLRVLRRKPEHVPTDLLQALANAFEEVGVSPMQCERLVLIRRRRGAPRKDVAGLVRAAKIKATVSGKIGKGGRNRRRSPVTIREEVSGEFHVGRSTVYAATKARKQRKTKAK